MTTNATALRIIELMAADGIEAARVEPFLDKMDDAQLAEMLTSVEKSAEENATFRTRLVAAPVLTAALCPPADWKTAADRRDVAKRAAKIVDAAAEKNGTTAEAIAEALVAEFGTVADMMKLYIERTGELEDPRVVQWGHSFYAFRYRVVDAVQVACAERLRVEAADRRAKQDAAWERKGLKRCQRCDGQGGRKEWPGFSCFDCDGRCAV